MKPLIGITPSPGIDELGHGTFYRYSLSRTYVDSVRSAGGTPMILPTDIHDIEDSLGRLDGLIISGGGDLDPATYGDPVTHERTYGVDHERDTYETQAFRFAVATDLPTLCICRGIQVMAVAQGGTLVQDIPSQVPGALEHRQSNLGKMRDEVSQTVHIPNGNPLGDIMGQSELEVNSFHHQSVNYPGADLVVVASTSDGVIEALWHPQMQFGLGVQWHPEMLATRFSRHAALFSAFISAATPVLSTR
jgi:putative glutamine amidotransferase